MSGKSRAAPAPGSEHRAPDLKGTRSIARTAQLLKSVAERGGTGWQLAALAERCELDKSTAHRILNCLVRERLVTHRPNGRYSPGPVMLELGLAMRGHQRFLDLAEQRLTALAGGTGLTAGFYLHSGDETVCAITVGTATTRDYVEEGIGHRRPLVRSVPGIAILIALQASERDAIVERNLTLLRRREDPRVPAYLEMLKDSGAACLSVHEEHWFTGVNSYGVAVCGADSEVCAALALSGSTDELPVARRSEIAKILRAESAELGRLAVTLLV